MILAIANLGFFAAESNSFANSKHDQMTGRKLTSVGCQRQVNYSRAVARQSRGVPTMSASLKQR
jgi:hypothetical protein